MRRGNSSSTLHLNSRGLPANQSHGAKLTVVTNGGVAEVPLRLELVARPFTAAPFQGVKAQRELAERMRTQPKAAVPLLESGEVKRWFETNGWTYPVAGPEVHGVAAVQQFFEALGLSKPPQLQVSSSEIRLRCKHPESARHQITLSTPAKKWVYATISSDSAWLKVPQPQVSGPQQTSFLIEVDSSRMATVGAHGEAKIKIVGNGGQALEVRVIADVTGLPGGKSGYAPTPRTPVPPTPAPSHSGMRAGLPSGLPSLATKGLAVSGARSNFIASLLILPLVLLLVRLAMVPIADGYLRGAAVHAAAARLDVHVSADSAVGGWAGWLRLPWPTIMSGDGNISTEQFDPANQGEVKAADFRDYFVKAFTRMLALYTWWIGGLAGAVLLWRRGGVLDVPWGFVAGSIAGLAGMATFACAFLVVEMVPQFLWQKITGDSGGLLALPGWVILALVWWLILGVGTGIVCAMLPPLRRMVLLPLQRVPAALLRALGLPGVAAFWWTPLAG